MSTRINWNYPQPRTGLAGALDKFFGPGTTSAEAWLEAVFAVMAGVALPTYAFLKGFEWTPVQYLVATFLALDIAGGIVTNATTSAKRWYHREGRGFRAHFGFVALHVVYIFVDAPGRRVSPSVGRRLHRLAGAAVPSAPPGIWAVCKLVSAWLLHLLAHTGPGVVCAALVSKTGRLPPSEGRALSARAGLAGSVTA